MSFERSSPLVVATMILSVPAGGWTISWCNRSEATTRWKHLRGRKVDNSRDIPRVVYPPNERFLEKETCTWQ
jgi:hypothetical protein